MTERNVGQVESTTEFEYKTGNDAEGRRIEVDFSHVINDIVASSSKLMDWCYIDGNA